MRLKIFHLRGFIAFFQAMPFVAEDYVVAAAVNVKPDFRVGVDFTAGDYGHVKNTARLARNNVSYVAFAALLVIAF